MPWFLNPNVYNKLPLYQNPELYLFIFKVAAAAAFALLLWRGGVAGKRIAAMTCIFIYGTFLTVMLSMHNIVIIGLRIFERGAGSDFSYDFHLYSLLLLGTILFIQGINLIRSALLLKSGDEDGIRLALRATWIVLALAVPLIPIQFFGIVLTVFSLLNLAAIKLLLTRSGAGRRTDAEKNLLSTPNFGFDN